MTWQADMNKTKKNGITALSIVIAITIILGSLNFLDQKKMFSSENKKTDIMKTFSTNKNGYIAKIHINGVIQEANRTYSQKWLVETIKKLKEDKNNKAIALYIDSPGGALYETDEVYLLLQDYKTAGKKIYAYQNKMAASGAYYISCAADKIYANRNALIGSIGVICGASMDFTDFMNNLGIKSKTFHSGKNKTMMNYNEPLTDEQITIMQSICDNAYEQFTGIVAAGRNLSMEQTTKLSDGRIYTAKQGLENGLVDAVDSWENMIRNMKDTEFEGKDLSVTEFNYERETSLSDFIMGKFGLSQTAAMLEDYSSEYQITFPALLYK